jgi:hypothetical protein
MCGQLVVCNIRLTFGFPLFQVYFPSLVVCNLNGLRKSFIYSLLSDPTMNRVTFEELHSVVDKMFIKGREDEPSQREQELTELLLDSSVLETLFNEFRTFRSADLVSNLTISNIPQFTWHPMEQQGHDFTNCYLTYT